ncbi:hypothetical protein POM88_007392 [Heracleum sosnowskyi]|uniref:PDZ domain-containing protein n=1 Tax=Heracleum sosnowskyi TaxID=360622 RepID=A0AAD8J623_9APIA|nr:hypothetical protein POM88_007392 [Heracleum sosnowskyi]
MSQAFQVQDTNRGGFRGRGKRGSFRGRGQGRGNVPSENSCSFQRGRGRARGGYNGRGRGEYQSFRIGSDGNLRGVGLFINVDPKTGHLVVMSCVEGSPADRAGLHEGDELIEINVLQGKDLMVPAAKEQLRSYDHNLLFCSSTSKERLDGTSSEGAAQKLRGQVGTSVTVNVHRGNISGDDDNLREVLAHSS